MTEWGRIILKTISLVFLVTILIIGFFRSGNSRKTADKLMYSFVVIGSAFTLIFVINV